MRHASLFSGIGGFDLAAQWMGWENVFQVEIDGFCQRVLEKNFPNTKRYGDIKQFDGTEWTGKIDVLTGGFPCQPFSVAGKRRGDEDDRYLWPEMLRVIREVQPTFVVGENVFGLVSWSWGLVFDQVQASLEDYGYEVQSCILPACSVKASHRRDRVWIVAHSKSVTMEKSEMVRKGWALQQSRESTKRYAWPIWSPSRETDFSEMVGELYGVSDWVDRSKSLGNAIVPQVAFEIFKAIEQVNQNL